MSHFTVLVIGSNPENQLAPYSEHIEVDEYLSEIVSDEGKKRMMEHYIKEHPELKDKSFDEIYAIYGDDWDGNRLHKNEEGVWCEYSTYNPKSKWDWYQLGGRWTGFFKAKPGVDAVAGDPGLMTAEAEDGYADYIRKGDVDFDAMKEETRKEAEEQYDKVMTIFGDAPANIPWEKVLEMENMDIDEKREFYHNQPRCQAVRNNKMWIEVDDYLCTKEEYVARQVNSTYVPYAFVMNGEWYGKGKMGWWGMSSDDKDQNEWNEEVCKLIEGLPDDTELWLYDCHI